MKNLFVALLFISGAAMAANDWAKNYGTYGCGRMSEGEAYQKGIQQAQATAGQYKATCDQQAGTFSWSYKKGFCTPWDPNDMICATECLIYSTVSCRTPLMQAQIKLKEVVGNQNGIPEPGETLAGEIPLTNLKGQELKNVLAEAKITSGQELVTLPSPYLAWDNIPVGQTASSLAPLEIRIANTANCGASFGLGLKVSSSAGTQELSQTLRLGKFNGAALVKESTGTTAIGGTGQTLSIPIELATSTVKPTPRKVQFSFRAKTNGQKYVRFVLSSPKKEVSKVVSEGWASGEFVYDQDLTQVFSKVNTLGDWTLEAKVNGQTDEGTLLSYKLLVFPDSYLCE